LTVPIVTKLINSPKYFPPQTEMAHTPGTVTAMPNGETPIYIYDHMVNSLKQFTPKYKWLGWYLTQTIPLMIIGFPYPIYLE
jgi:hypothetical protein